MKKFFMALAAVAMVATSCVQGDDDFAVKGPQKSVQFSLANVITSRGVDAPIENATKVNLKNYQVFFVGSDGTLYSGKDVDGGTVSHYFETAPTEVQTFHFLPAAVAKVVVVGNYGSKITATKLDDIKAIATTWENQQDDENLLVYGEAELEPAAANDQHANTYKADVNVKPLVARIEVSGFACTFSTEPLYEKIDVTMVKLNNFYPTSNIGGVVSPADIQNSPINDETAYPFFNATAPAYSKDEIAVSLTPSAAAVELPDTGYLVYNFFPGAVPQLVARVAGTNGTSVAPLYLATNGFKQNGVSVTEFTPGTIYRMNFAFADTALAQPEKCVEVSIEVAEWVVVNVTPEF